MSRTRNSVTLVAVACFLFWTAAPCMARQSALAIFNLRPTNIEAMGYTTDLLYALISTLEKEKTVELMPRREMEEILFHASLVQGDNPELVAKAGKVLGIHFVLFGHVTKKGQQIHASLKLMDIEKNQVVKTWTPIFSGREAILNEVPALARELSRSILNKASAASSTTVVSSLPQIDIKNFRAESRGAEVVLRWKIDSSQPPVAFNVYRSESQEGPYQLLGKSNENTYNDPKVTKGRSYCYRLGIVLGSGQEIKSRQSARIKSLGEKIPYPPLILGGKGHVRRTSIKFVPSLQNEQGKFKIEEYKIYRQKTAEGAWENISSIKAELTSQSELAFNVEDTKATDDDNTYTYAVSSVDKENRESPLSDPLALTTIRRPVLRVVKDNLLRRVMLAWQPLENVKGYYLYRRSDDNDVWIKIAEIEDAAIAKTEDRQDLEDGRFYQYNLTANDARGETGPSNQVKAKIKDRPNPPDDLLSESGLVKSIRIRWASVNDPDVGGYYIYRGANPKTLKRIEKIKEHASDSFVDKGLTFEPLEDGSEHFYAVTSYNLFGAEGNQSPAVIARTKPRPKGVKGFMAMARQRQIALKWEPNPEPDIKTYFLYRNQNNGSWSKIIEKGRDQTDYQDNDLKPAIKYRYKIIAEDKDGLQSDPQESDTILSPLVKAAK